MNDFTYLLEEAYASEFDGEYALAHLAAIEDILVKNDRLKHLAHDLSEEELSICAELDSELVNATIALVDKQTMICGRGINSPSVRMILKQILLDYCELRTTLLLQPID